MINASKLDLTRATKQDVFDYVVFALIQQGKQASNVGSCLYRAADGCRCAAGHLIPDDEYHPRLEGKTIAAAITGRDFDNDYNYAGPPLIPSLASWLEAAGGDGASRQRSALLHELQAAHDQRDEPTTGRTDASWLTAFRARARGIAIGHGLDHTILSYRAPASFAVQAGRSIFGAKGIGADDEVPTYTLADRL